jgi:transposase
VSLERRLNAVGAERKRLEAELAQARAERDRLEKELDRAYIERDEYRKLYQEMLERHRKLELGLLGQKAERLSPSDAQLTMSLLATMLAEPASVPVPEIDVPETEPSGDEADSRPEDDEHKARPKRGRKRLPETLPRVEVRLVPPEVEREGTDQFEVIGEEVCEVVERRKASVVVVRIIRPKFVRKDRARNAETEVFTAPAVELPIERGIAGPGVLAETIVRRFDDHLPANRQEHIWSRDGIEISRSTICNWHFQLHYLIAPLIVAMWKDALGSPWLATDATGVLVQAKDKCRRGHFWTVIAPERHVLYAYSAKHDSAAVDAILKDYKGYLAADAHAVYDHLYRTGEVIEVACWAHCRRYFFKALDSDPERARHAIAIIKGLFDIEDAISNKPSGKRRATRARDSQPLVDRFFTWCAAQAPLVVDETPIARAIHYALNQRAALKRFLTDESLPLHNNASENALRRQAVGRANWTFLGNDEAGQVNAAFVSLLASCRLHEVEPWAYLRDLLCLLPSWPVRRVLELAPVNWRKTLQQEETQRRLDENVFRRITLE